MEESAYFMTNAILSQPDEIERAVGSNMEDILTLSSAMRTGFNGRIFIIGTGSSYHSARLAAPFFKEGSHGNMTVEALPMSSYGFVNNTPPLSKEDVVVVVSHRGYKSYSNRSLKLGRDAGCRVVAVTGFESTIEAKDAWIVFRTCSQEKSSAHTVSLTTGLSILLSVATALSFDADIAAEEVRKLIGRIAADMRRAISSSSGLRSLVSGHDCPGRVWISGSGQNKIVAQEAALKIQETSYLDAYGFETEQMIHGPMRAASLADDLFVPIVWGQERTRERELSEALDYAGSRVITVSDRADEKFNCLDADFSWSDSLSPFFTLPPLQMLALYLAVKRGTNPDSFRNTDPAFAKLDSKLKL